MYISKIIYKFALPNLHIMKKDKRNKTKNDAITTTKPINRKGVVMFGDRYVDMERVLVPRKNKKVKDFINELEPNFERIFDGKLFSRFIVLSSKNGLGTVDGIYDENFFPLYLGENR